MKQWHVHYMNKYPQGRVSASESAMDVYDSEGVHCVALRKDGGGNLVDRSEELGCKDRHDLSPIPKDARLYKVCPIKGHITKDEKFEQRKDLVEDFMVGTKVGSCVEDLKHMSFDEKQRLQK